jgi:hypothetical protein
VLKKTSAYIGLVIATAAGAVLANSSADAQVNLMSGSHHRFHHRSHNRNWNGNHHRHRIFIRIYIYNKNNNRAIAIARPERERHSRLDGDPVAFGGGARGGGGAGGAGARGAGARGAGQRDTGQRDTGQRDTGQRDTGQRDTGQRDTGQRDTGQRDAGEQSNRGATADQRPVATNEGTTPASGDATGQQAAPRDNPSAVGTGARSNDVSFGDATPMS